MSGTVVHIHMRGPESHVWAFPEEWWARPGDMPRLEVGAPGHYEIRARLQMMGDPKWTPWSAWAAIETGAELTVVVPTGDRSGRGLELSFGPLLVRDEPPPPPRPAMGFADFAELRRRLGTDP